MTDEMTQAGSGRQSAVPVAVLADADAKSPKRWRRPLHCLQLQGDRVRPLRDAGAPEPAWTRWADWCAAHPGARCRVLLGASAQQALALAVGLPQQADSALRRHAQSMLAQVHGAAAEDWPLALWRSAAARGVVALAQPALLLAARQHGVQLLALQPAWWWALHAALRDDAVLRHADEAMLLLRDDDGVGMLVALRHGAQVGLLVRRLAPGPAALADPLSDPMSDPLSDPLSAPQQAECLAALGLSGQALLRNLPLWPLAATAWAMPAWRWALAPDFRGPARPPRLAWLALAAAVVALALAATDACQAWQARQDADQRLAQAAQTPPLADGADPLLVDAAASSAGAEREAALRLQAAALALPWGQGLAAVEAATAPGVRWLKLDQTSTGMRLEGLAPDVDIALLVTARLARQSGLRQVVLTRLQQQAAGAEAGVGGLLFELQALRVQP